MIEDAKNGPSDIARMIKIGVCADAYDAALFLLIALDHEFLDYLSDGMATFLVFGSALTVLAITFLWINVLKLSPKPNEPVAPSTKRARLILLMSGLFGGVLAVGFYIFQGSNLEDVSLFSNSLVPPSIGIGAAVIYVIGMIYACYEWQKSSDEHERASINAGLYASFYSYAIFAPAWWMAQRTLLVPAQDPMIMYVLVLTVFAAVWTYKRGS